MEGCCYFFQQNLLKCQSYERQAADGSPQIVVAKSRTDVIILTSSIPIHHYCPIIHGSFNTVEMKLLISNSPDNESWLESSHLRKQMSWSSFKSKLRIQKMALALVCVQLMHSFPFLSATFFFSLIYYSHWCNSQ